MIQSLRNYFPKWSLAIFLGIIIFIMVFLGLYNPQSEEYQKANAVMITVNKKNIRRIEFVSAYENLKQQKSLNLDTSFRFTSLIEQQLRAQAMQQIIIAEVLKQSAQQRGYRVHPQDLANTLRKIPAFQVNQQFSLSKFEEMLSKIGYTRTAFLSALMEEISTAQVQSGIIDTAFVLPGEVTNAICLVKQKRDFDYIEIAASRFIKKAKISNKNIRDYYESHLTEFRVPAQVSINYIMLSLSNIKNQLKHQHPHWKNDYLEEKAAQQFKETLILFTKHQKAHSNDLVELSKVLQIPMQSTELFTQTNGQSNITKHPEVIKTAFSQNTLKGYNSPIIKMDDQCFLILKLKQYKPAHLAAFENVQAKIRQHLLLEQAQKAVQEYGETLVEQLKKSKLNSTNWPNHLRWKSQKQVTRYDTKIPSVILNAAFKMPYNPNNPNIMGFILANGNYVIIRLNQVMYGTMKQSEKSQYCLYQEELALEAGQFEYNLYVHQNLQSAKINYLISAMDS